MEELNGKDAENGLEKEEETGTETDGKSSQDTGDKPHPTEELLDEYPLRDPGEDPVWSVRIVKGWIWFLVFCILGIVLLLFLGFIYD